MKKSKIDSIVLAMGCTEKLMPDPMYVTSDQDIISQLGSLENFDIRDAEGRTLLMYASLYARSKIIIFLLAHNADIQAQDKRGFTALHFATQAGNVDSVAALLNAGANPNAKDNFGNSSMMRCNYDTPSCIFEMLLKYGADPFQRNNFGMSAMDVFSAQRSIMDIINTFSNTCE